ncbi:hypothetical protein BgAZ_103890 [Babesia gibsoni]|uniref:Uncharacterized protein n=1 Tax=Babesia gibsoni TaxID=33632 RepID=A0AAD8PFU5_BABGI|nr:hypothetical protein BgAZ_103890 [Babesia gibsoni]
MEKFPFYSLEPSERVSKLKDHFLSFEEVYTNQTIESELKVYKEELDRAAKCDPDNHDVMLKLGDATVVEVDVKEFSRAVDGIGNI